MMGEREKPVWWCRWCYCFVQTFSDYCPKCNTHEATTRKDTNADD